MLETARGYAKLLLFGEHAAIYGHPAVGTTLYPLFYEVDILETRSPATSDRLPRLGQLDALAVELFKKACRFLRREVPEISFRVHGNIPPQSGLGSSAALCVAIARIVLGAPETPDVPLPDEQGNWRDSSLAALRLANQLEAQFHGTPSGIDVCLALGGGLQMLQPKLPDIPSRSSLRQAAPVWLVLSSVAKPQGTAVLVKQLRDRMQAGDDSIRTSIANLGAISLQAMEVLETSTSPSKLLGNLANKAQAVLSGLGLANGDMDRLMARALSAGALGAKLSGAGGGGAFYCVADGEMAAHAIAQEITKEASSRSIALLMEPLVICLNSGK